MMIRSASLRLNRLEYMRKSTFLLTFLLIFHSRTLPVWKTPLRMHFWFNCARKQCRTHQKSVRKPGNGRTFVFVSRKADFLIYSRRLSSMMLIERHLEFIQQHRISMLIVALPRITTASKWRRGWEGTEWWNRWSTTQLQTTADQQDRMKIKVIRWFYLQYLKTSWKGSVGWIWCLWLSLTS